MRAPLGYRHSVNCPAGTRPPAVKFPPASSLHIVWQPDLLLS